MKGGATVTKRNRFHARTEVRIARFLDEWVDRQQQPRGAVYSGEVGCRLREDSDSGCGIDVAYFSAAVIAAQTDASTLMVGPPILAVEVLSPSETVEEIDEKVDEYLAAVVAYVWLVDTHSRAVTVIRPDEPPILRNVTDVITAEPDLPGFSVPVRRLFDN